MALTERETEQASSVFDAFVDYDVLETLKALDEVHHRDGFVRSYFTNLVKRAVALHFPVYFAIDKNVETFVESKLVSYGHFLESC